MQKALRMLTLAIEQHDELVMQIAGLMKTTTELEAEVVVLDKRQALMRRRRRTSGSRRQNLRWQARRSSRWDCAPRRRTSSYVALRTGRLTGSRCLARSLIGGRSRRSLPSDAGAGEAVSEAANPRNPRLITRRRTRALQDMIAEATSASCSHRRQLRTGSSPEEMEGVAVVTVVAVVVAVTPMFIRSTITCLQHTT